jgi:hypothetical protein
VNRSVPRRHRKAGSGPPAAVLIAWIGTDPYLREAAATASYRHEITLPLPSRARSAKMAVATCFVLASSAVLGITTIISHGRGAAQDKIVTSSSSPGSVPASAPVGITPMLADPATPGPIADRLGDSPRHLRAGKPKLGDPGTLGNLSR